MIIRVSCFRTTVLLAIAACAHGNPELRSLCAERGSCAEAVVVPHDSVPARTLIGVVVDSATHKPVKGALIEASRSQRLSTAGDDGWFQLNYLAPGEDTLHLSAPCYRPHEESIHVPSGAGLRAVLPLTRLAHCVNGVVHDPSVPPPPRSVPVAPFRLVGNIYYVGTTDVTAYLIRTSHGFILIDGGYEETAGQILQSIRTLGFDPARIRILLNSHAHYDHAGGLAELKRVTGAPLYAGRGDSAVLARGGRDDPGFGNRYRFPPVVVDHPVADGDRIILGSDTIVAIATPGHTKGCTTWSMNVRPEGYPVRALFICSLSIPGYDLRHHPPYPGIVADYRASIARLKQMNCGLWFMPHAAQFDLATKMTKPTFPISDQFGCRKYLDEAEKAVDDATK